MYTHSQKEMERQQICVNTIADQRYKINHWACRGELNQMMEERFVKGNELVSVLELLQKLSKKSLQYRPKQTPLEEIVLDIHACYKQE